MLSSYILFYIFASDNECTQLWVSGMVNKCVGSNCSTYSAQKSPRASSSWNDTKFWPVVIFFLPAETIVCTLSAERKQSGYCVPLGWPAPILKAPIPPTMTSRGIDVHCHRICASPSCGLLNLSLVRLLFIRDCKCDDRAWYPAWYRCLWGSHHSSGEVV